MSEEIKKNETAEAKKVKEKKDDRVEVVVPRGREREDSNVTIGINGKTYILPRGKKSLVPPEVAAEYERSVKAEDTWHDKKAGMSTGKAGA